MNFLNDTPKATRSLIIINIFVFIAYCINKEFMTTSFALFYPTSPYFHVWQYVTHMFMHGGFWHIFFNMYALWLFGSIVERMIGERKFLILYFVCGFGAVALHLGVEYLEMASAKATLMSSSDPTALSKAHQAIASINSTPTVGASGAIYGLLIAYAMLFPDQRLTLIFPPISMKARTWVIIFAVIELFTGVTGVMDGVAHFAHLGGMLFGFLLIRYWRKKGILFDRYGY